MAGSTVVHDVGMVNECTGKGIGVMARPAIVGRSRVSGYRRPLAGRVDTVIVIVARFTGLDCRIN